MASKLTTPALTAARRGSLLLAVWLIVIWPADSPAQVSPSAASYYSRGTERYAKGDMEGAIAVFEIAIAFAPDYAEAFYSLGSSLYAKRDLGRALTAFEKAISLNPRMASYFSARGVTRERSGIWMAP